MLMSAAVHVSHSTLLRGSVPYRPITVHIHCRTEQLVGGGDMAMRLTSVWGMYDLEIILCLLRHAPSSFMCATFS